MKLRTYYLLTKQKTHGKAVRFYLSDRFFIVKIVRDFVQLAGKEFAGLIVAVPEPAEQLAVAGIKPAGRLGGCLGHTVVGTGNDTAVIGISRNAHGHICPELVIALLIQQIVPK